MLRAAGEEDIRTVPAIEVKREALEPGGAFFPFRIEPHYGNRDGDSRADWTSSGNMKFEEVSRKVTVVEQNLCRGCIPPGKVSAFKDGDDVPADKGREDGAVVNIKRASVHEEVHDRRIDDDAFTSEPEEVAAMVFFLVDQGTFCTGGHYLVDGGLVAHS